MTRSPRTMGMQNIRHQRTLTMIRNRKGGSACQCTNDYILFYPHWYRTDQEGVLSLSCTSGVPMRKVARTPVRDWRLELETLTGAPLSASLRPFQGQVTYSVFFDLDLPASWQDGEPMWFPPRAYVHLSPFLYRTDAQSRLHVLGPFFPNLSTPEAFVLRFAQLTGIDPFTTQIVKL